MKIPTSYYLQLQYFNRAISYIQGLLMKSKREEMRDMLRSRILYYEVEKNNLACMLGEERLEDGIYKSLIIY